MNATHRTLFVKYWSAYLKYFGIDGIMTDIEGFAAGQPTSPNWYSNESLVSLMKEVKSALPEHVLIFPIQTNYWATVDKIGGGIDFGRMAQATDGMFLMACPSTHAAALPKI